MNSGCPACYGPALGGSQPAGDHWSGGAVGESASLGGSALGVNTAGLRWTLRGETLLTGAARGVSNEMTGSRARVSLSSGVLLLIQRKTEVRLVLSQ